MLSFDKRLWESIEVAGDCWEWKLYRNEDGYGKIKRNGKTYVAHRYIFTLLKGNIPLGKELDHLCKNRSCVNPEHLEAVDHLENVRRGDAMKPRKPWKRKNLKRVNPNNKNTKLFCKNGHSFSDNAYDRHDGKGRNCRLCVRQRSKDSYQRKKVVKVYAEESA